MRREIKEEYENWFSGAFKNTKTIAFTLNFEQRLPSAWLTDHQTGKKTYRKPEQLTEKLALATYRRWYNGLRRRAFGSKAMARNESAKLQHVVVKEGKISREDHTARQFHLHGVIEVPVGMHFSQWADICESDWISLPWADAKSYDFTQYRDEGWIEYMLKRSTKDDLEESILLDIMHLDADAMRSLRWPAPVFHP